MIAISSTELRQKVGFYKRLADFEPVEVTRAGKPSTVLMSSAEYSRLKANDISTSGLRLGETASSTEI
jgi:prevent-host-death family protein